MNSEFKDRALHPVDPKTVWSVEADPLHAYTPMSEQDSGLGYVPVNRHDRRKAKKLLRQKR